MRVAIVLLLFVLAGTAAFVTLNWGAVITPVDLSLGVGMVKMPLGLVMLGLLLAITALFLVFVLFLQTSVLLETRRQAKEIRASRDLADQAEASRFTELRSFLEAEFPRFAWVFQAVEVEMPDREVGRVVEIGRAHV